FFVSEVISESELFDAEAYYENSKKIAGIVKIADGIAVFTDPKRSTVYLGNVAKFDIQDSGKNLSAYLTLAFELENVINQLSLSYAQTALIIVGNKVVSSIQPNKHIGLDINISEENIRTIIGSRSGKLNISGREDYYITVKPFPSVDLIICLLTPFDVEYALFNDLQNKLESLNVKITLSKDGINLLGVIMVIVLVFNFTKKITKPIIAISAAARTIQNGALDQVVLPTLNFGVSNEVQILNNAFKDMVEGLKEKERVKGILDKVVSQDIAKEILKQGIELGGEERKATIFFADIRGFTRTTQNMDPSDVIKMLNECMTRLSKIIELHHGVIDKYVGDEVMVLFGAPIASDNAAINAVVCGLEIIKELNQWNVIRTAEGLPQVMMGIGIHTGLVFAGNMGAENRLNYTVIGSNVNLAARLCGAAGPGEILISNATRNEICVRDEIEVDDLGLLSFKGFDGAEQVFRVKGIK
ncbi:MAG: HAMP domain-containing protein, partial [Chlamydiae bacterium]|nr:HAMP domain-containing protein [Chlamydiota bacterium]